MATYIYCPVMTDEMVFYANRWKSDRTSRNKPAYGVIGASDSGKRKALRHLLTSGKLSSVADDDKVYVLAHGIRNVGDGAVVIGARRGDWVQSGQSLTGYTVQGGAMKMYYPGEFAEHLEKEGLSKGFVDLRLFCCGSGLVAESQKYGDLDPYAQRLRGAMVQRGYNNVAVTGYLGDLSHEHIPRFAPGSYEARDEYGEGTHKGVQIAGSYKSRAKNHRVRFPPME